MADVFISYSRADRAAAERLASELEALGASVWMDNQITGGSTFTKVTEAELNRAGKVVVLWSKTSIESGWVCDEAQLGRDQGKLVPLSIDGSQPPMGFRQIQTLDMAGWVDSGNAEVPPGLTEALMLRMESAPAGASRFPRTQPVVKASQASVVVLPFANMSREEEQDYFADGITEDIITDLSKVSALGVISRNSAFTFKGKNVDIPDVARQLNVTHVVEGSVRKAGNRVRVTAQLIDGSTNNHVWADRWDRDLDDIFELQDELSQAIVGALKVRLLPEEKKAVETRDTTDFETYDKYLRARAATNSAATATDFYQAQDLYRQVLDADPRFAPAMSGLILTYMQLLVFDPSARERLVREIEELSRATIAGTPNSWETYLLAGQAALARADWSGTMHAYGEAAKLAPASETFPKVAHAQILANVGRVGEAIALLEGARELDPLASEVSAFLQLYYLCAGRDANSRAEYDRMRDQPGLRVIMEHLALVRIWESGDMEAAKAQIRRLSDFAEQGSGFHEDLLDAFGDREAMLGLLCKALDDPEFQNSVGMMGIAFYASLGGDPSLALTALRRAVIDYGHPAVSNIWLSIFRETRKLEGFKQFAIDAGLHDYWRESGQWGDFARPRGDDDFEIVA